GWPRAPAARVPRERPRAGPSQCRHRRRLRALRADRARGEDARARRRHAGRHRHHLEPGQVGGLRVPHGSAPGRAGGKRRSEDAVPRVRRRGAHRDEGREGGEHLRRHRAAGREVRMTGQTDHNLRGDYSRMRPDYTVDQDWDAYTAGQHDLWRRLYARQAALVPDYACDEFSATLATLDYGAGIPRFEAINRMLERATAWQLVAVPGLLPDPVFFEHLAQRRFPVTVWLRDPQEFDYIVEPDIFHDFFGHVPLLFNPVFADYMQAYGRGGLKAHALGAIEMLARLYWYTVE